ncbi:MAG: 5-methyltetrahydropteroyltriglutamate--homocysteine S-methyltransferase [Novosphingobium sp.]|nr:5-methyltetrahydropteroyltriglutamate--homocysteine S-methyltransferase [Novosphingobium sp.]MBO9604250.1 5-methyltetrahydropteroyltriglutamate--homocysteine S-methyltransferase [Novosphingobium sp.]
MGRPFRADQVGSLLRPAALLEARHRHVSGAELKAIEDAAIREVVRKQEEVGLKGVTDGEYRRENWSLDFFAALQGTEVAELALTTTGQGTRTVPAAVVTGKVSAADHPMIEHIRFLVGTTKQTAKLTVPVPSMITTASRDWRQIVGKAYDGLDAFYADLGAAYAQFVQAAYDAGCRYIQFDDVNMAYLCDADMRAKLSARGDDPDVLLDGWVRLINAALANKPADMTVTTHICRGNFKSQWFAQGGYEPIAERLFNDLPYNGYFLEYDNDRSGGFEPLRFLPKGDKRVVLGLMTTKTGTLENRDLIRRRIDQASAIAPLDQLCLSPQCGFASHEDGNDLSEQSQWAKLRQIVELAQEIWPDA